MYEGTRCMRVVGGSLDGWKILTGMLRRFRRGLGGIMLGRLGLIDFGIGSFGWELEVVTCKMKLCILVGLSTFAMERTVHTSARVRAVACQICAGICRYSRLTASWYTTQGNLRENRGQYLLTMMQSYRNYHSIGIVYLRLTRKR